MNPEPTKADIATIRTLIRLCDLQRGYDDIDWRDKMKEIVPLFAGALAVQRETDAKVADTMAERHKAVEAYSNDDGDRGAMIAAIEIAAAIRGSKP